MQCANCGDEGETAFTLAAHVPDNDESVAVDFCSSACLQVWTADEEPDDDGDRKDGTAGEDRPGSGRSPTPADGIRFSRPRAADGNRRHSDADSTRARTY